MTIRSVRILPELAAQIARDGREAAERFDEAFRAEWWPKPVERPIVPVWRAERGCW